MRAGFAPSGSDAAASGERVQENGRGSDPARVSGRTSTSARKDKGAFSGLSSVFSRKNKKDGVGANLVNDDASVPRLARQESDWRARFKLSGGKMPADTARNVLGVDEIPPPISADQAPKARRLDRLRAACEEAFHPTRRKIREADPQELANVYLTDPRYYARAKREIDKRLAASGLRESSETHPETTRPTVPAGNGFNINNVEIPSSRLSVGSEYLLEEAGNSPPQTPVVADSTIPNWRLSDYLREDTRESLRPNPVVAESTIPNWRLSDYLREDAREAEQETPKTPKKVVRFATDSSGALPTDVVPPKLSNPVRGAPASETLGVTNSAKTKSKVSGFDFTRRLRFGSGSTPKRKGIEMSMIQAPITQRQEMKEVDLEELRRSTSASTGGSVDREIEEIRRSGEEGRSFIALLRSQLDGADAAAAVSRMKSSRNEDVVHCAEALDTFVEKDFIDLEASSLTNLRLLHGNATQDSAEDREKGIGQAVAYMTGRTEELVGRYEKLVGKLALIVESASIEGGEGPSEVDRDDALAVLLAIDPPRAKQVISKSAGGRLNDEIEHIYESGQDGRVRIGGLRVRLGRADVAASIARLKNSANKKVAACAEELDDFADFATTAISRLEITSLRSLSALGAIDQQTAQKTARAGIDQAAVREVVDKMDLGRDGILRLQDTPTRQLVQIVESARVAGGEKVEAAERDDAFAVLMAVDPLTAFYVQRYTEL